MNYQKIDKFSIADGCGVRVVLWVSGCTLHCKGCHNPETHSFSEGHLVDIEEIKEHLNAYLALAKAGLATMEAFEAALPKKSKFEQ